MPKIAVIGKSIRIKKFDSLWEILEEAEEEGEIELSAYQLETWKGTIDKTQYDGIIYIATPLTSEVPSVYLPLQASNGQIENALLELSSKMKKQSNKKEKKVSVIAEIEGKEVKLTEEDVKGLAKIKEICSLYGYKIIQTIIE